MLHNLYNYMIRKIICYTVLLSDSGCKNKMLCYVMLCYVMLVCINRSFKRSASAVAQLVSLSIHMSACFSMPHCVIQLSVCICLRLSSFLNIHFFFFFLSFSFLLLSSFLNIQFFFFRSALSLRSLD